MIPYASTIAEAHIGNFFVYLDLFLEPSIFTIS